MSADIFFCSLSDVGMLSMDVVIYMSLWIQKERVTRKEFEARLYGMECVEMKGTAECGDHNA